VAKIEQLIGGDTRLPACYIRQNAACQSHDTLPDLGRITQPVLVMGGDSDPICSLTATAMLSDGLPNVRTEIFKDASHFFLMEQPEKFMRLLGGWLAEQGGGR
jgi:3-oxoadipate enol-lactonase